MRASYGLLLVALTAALAGAVLFAGVRLLAPQREEPPTTDFAELAAVAARRVEDYGARHDGFRHLSADSLIVALPPGAGLRVSGDSARAVVVILRDGRPRCSVHITRGEPLTQPRCTTDR
jgi:hypothetical protein